MMQKLGHWWKKDPGLVVSGGVHLIGFLCLVLNIGWTHKPEETVENVPVEMVTTSDFNQIMNGEKTAKQMDTAQRRVDQVAVLEDHKSAPPIPDSVKDTPPPPAPEKANNDPGQAEKKEEANAPPPPAPPEKPEPVVPPAPVPTPPEKPVEKTEAPTPPEKPAETAATPTPPERPDDMKPPPEEAEAIEKKPPPKPKVEPKKEAKKEPKKVAKPKKTPKPVEVAEVKPAPEPPPKPVPPKPSLRERTLDQVASLLDRLKPPKIEIKMRSGNEVKEAKPTDYSLDKISALLDHEAPQRRASTGQKPTRLASLGSPTAHAEKMSPTLMAQIDGWLIDHYRGCWSYFGLGATTDYVPKIHVQMSIDGTLTARPVLVNQPSDPNLRSLADSALRAVNKCNPMPIPTWFRSHYEAWRDRTVRFDPKEMS